MNYQELKEKIEEVSVRDVCNGEVENDFPESQVVERIGGGEGGGEIVMRVAHFTEDNIFVKFTGYYQSYSGTTWDDKFIQVFPVQKMITVYETN